MRVTLALAALAAAALPATAAQAFPPDCDRYADKPCYTAREALCDAEGILAPLWLEDLPPRPETCP